MTHSDVSALVDVLGPVYLCSFALNMVAQVFAVGFAVACVIALCRPAPYCLVGRHLALWSLYSALTALAIPVSVGVVILCLRLLQPSEESVEIMRSAGSLVYDAARFTSPALSVGVLISLIARIRLRRAAPSLVPVLWFSATGDILVVLIAGIPLAFFALVWFFWK